MKEIWKNIDGYFGKYRISNCGKILNQNGKEISQRKNNKGYVVVDLYINGKRKSKLVHRLVALNFLENSKNYTDVNHIDENKENNNVLNLEWCSHKENVSKWCLNNPQKVGRKNFTNKITYRKHNKKILMISIDGNILMIFNDLRSVKDYLMKDMSPIIKCCDGKRKTAYGYKWEFAD